MEEMKVHRVKMMKIRGDDECNEDMGRSKIIRESERKEGRCDDRRMRDKSQFFCDFHVYSNLMSRNE